jgi:hypothetical protein
MLRKHHTPKIAFPASSLEDNMVSNAGYSWLPAGFVPSSNFRSMMLIRHRKLTQAHFNYQNAVQVGANVWDVTLELPDRTVRIIPFSEPFNPDEWDEVRYIDPFDPRSHHGDKLTWVLGSAHYAMDKVDFNWGNPADIKVVMDSGGAQLKIGTADYVDPRKVIEVMNSSANAGFSLDVPPRLGVDLRDESTLKALAYLQVRNNKIFLEERRPDLALLNVLHGVSKDEQTRWFDTVYADGFQGYALGIDDSNDVLSGVRGAIMLHENLKGQDFWLHVFGVSGPKMIPALAWFGRVHGRVSSDSSSWYEGSRRAKYFELNKDGYMKDYRLSTQMLNPKDPLFMLRQPKNKADIDLRWMPGGFLPCQCPICTNLKNVEGMIGHYYDATLISLHDLFTLKNFGHMWNTMAQTMPIDEYINATRQIMGSRSADMVEYIHVGLEHGLDAAERMFRGGPNKKHKTVNNSLVANTTEGRKLSLFGNRAEKEELADTPESLAADAADAAQMKADIADEIEMENALAEDLAADSEDGDEEEVADAGYEAMMIQHLGVKTIYDKDVVLLEEDNDKYGVCAKLKFFTPSTVPNIGMEPRYGWPLTNEVAKFSTAWAPTQTTKYQTMWRKGTPSRVMWAPPVPEYLQSRVPDSVDLNFPPDSTMECVLNYVDITNPEHIAELDELDPRIVDWILFKLEHDPDIFRMMEITDAMGKQKRKRVNKESIVNTFYLEIRALLDAREFDKVPYLMTNELLKKKETTEQTQKGKKKKVA